MKYPTISIVTACHNHEKYIAETIESILSQNYPSLQYVVINDGSTDKSDQIIKKYRKYLHYYEDWSGYRKTVIPALNKAFSKTDGEIMGWLNSKNILLPKSLFTIAEILSQLKRVEWLTGVATTIDDKGKIINVCLRKKNIYDYLIGNWQVIQQESTFWRRSLWERTGGKLNEGDKWAFDTGLWARFFKEAELYHVNTILGAYRKILTARSIRSKDVYKEYSDKAIQRLKKSVSRKKFRLAKYYRVLYFFKNVLRNIPDKFYIKIPFLNRFYHFVINYKLEDQKWHISKKNPFRKNF